jgi:hypothetical protein
MAEQTYTQRYADGDDNTAGAFGFDQVSSVDYAISKVAFGDANTITRVTASVGLPVQLLAGTAAVGKLAANDGVDIGDVTINNASIAVTGTFWQATQPVSVATIPSHDVTNAGTFAVQAAQSGTWNVTNISGTVSLPTGAATAAKQPALGTAGTASADVITVQGIASMTALKVDGSAVTQPVSGTVTANAGTGSFTVAQATAANLNATVVGTGTFAVQAAQSGTWNVGTVTTVSAVTAITNALPAGTNNIGDVDVLTLPGAAHDAAVSGNPVRVGARAETALSGITLVADGDTTDLYAGVDGVLITRPHCNLEDIVSGVAAITDGSSTSVIAAAGSGVKVYVTSIVIANSSATAVTVDIRDGAAGTVKATYPVPANTAGVVHTLSVPLPFSANTAVCADPSASASTVTVTLIGFKSKV